VKKILTAISAAVVLVAMVIVISFAPTGFVIWTPSTTASVLDASPDQTGIQIYGRTSVSSGPLLAPSINQSGRDEVVTLPAVIFAHLMGHGRVVPRDTVYLSGQASNDTADQYNSQVLSSRESAVVAALRYAEVVVTERPMVASVREGGPADGLLELGDLILEIDSHPMETDEDVRSYVRDHNVDDSIVVKVLRDREQLAVSIRLGASPANRFVPTMGVRSIVMGYEYDPDIAIGLEIASGHPSQGLAIALATYSLWMEVDLSSGETLAATGTVSAAGVVSAVSGINQYARSAWNAGATLLLIPRANCPDLTEEFAGLAIVPVDTLGQAVSTLTGRNLPDVAPAHC
jgi:PDZ domain-containing protein